MYTYVYYGHLEYNVYIINLSTTRTSEHRHYSGVLGSGFGHETSWVLTFPVAHDLCLVIAIPCR